MTGFTMFWLPLSPEQFHFVAALGVHEPIHLPILVPGDEGADECEGQGLRIEITPATLLYGILHGASEDPPGVDMEHSSRYFLELLENLVPELGMPDLETTILTAGANVRHDLSAGVAARMLENGLRFVPWSGRIRSDCITCIWIAAQQRHEPDHRAVMREIVRLLDGMDFEDVHPDARKSLSCIATIAFSEVDPGRLERYIRESFTSEDLQWSAEAKAQVDAYLATRSFSWEALRPGS